MSIRRSRIIYRISPRHFTPDVILTHPVLMTPDAARDAIRVYRDKHGHLHVPSNEWVGVPGCRFPLGYWLHRQRQTRAGRRLLRLIGADDSEADQFFLDGLHHLRTFLHSKSISTSSRRIPSTMPETDPSDGFPLSFWYRQITSGGTSITDERRQWAADIIGTPAPVWVIRTLDMKGSAA